MGTRKGTKRRGSALIEFTIAAVPVIFVTLSIIEMSLESWKFETMVYAIQVAARYACVHGRTCTRNSNTCTITVGNVATLINTQAPSLDPALLNVTLATHSGTAATCNPLSSCLSTATQFPSAIDNGVGYDVTITATYPMYNPLAMMWFGNSSKAGTSFTLGAVSKQTIVY
jgi:Flp pilus assembly protein TadG